MSPALYRAEARADRCWTGRPCHNLLVSSQDQWQANPVPHLIGTHIDDGGAPLTEPNIMGGRLPLIKVKMALKRGETDDAEMLAMLYRDRLTYDHTEGRWYPWNGNHWEPDRTDQVSNPVAYQVAAQYLNAAGELQRQEQTARELTDRPGSQTVSSSIAALLSKRIHGVFGEQWPEILPPGQGTPVCAADDQDAAALSSQDLGFGRSLCGIVDIARARGTYGSALVLHPPHSSAAHSVRSL
jgi:hypothetical protein